MRNYRTKVDPEPVDMIERVPAGTSHPDRRYRRIYKVNIEQEANAATHDGGANVLDQTAWNDSNALFSIRDEGELEVYDESRSKWILADPADAELLYAWEWWCIAPREVPVLTPTPAREVARV